MNISVVIPLYNKSYSIERALDSVLNQSHLPYEVIVIDDGSTDNSAEKVEDFIRVSETTIIRLYRIKNSGVSLARNYGVDKAKSDYIAFLDADDQWLENHLLDKIGLIKNNPNAALFSSRHTVISETEGETFEAKNPFSKDYYGLVDDFFLRSTVSSIANSSKVLINKKCFLSVGGFPVGVVVAEDLFLWIALSLKYDVMYSSNNTVNIFIETDFSRTHRKKTIPYPIVYYRNKDIPKNLSLYLRSIFLKHFVLYVSSGEYKTALNIYISSMPYFKKIDFFYFCILAVPPRMLNFIKNFIKERTMR
ncbi:glycosyltransferase family 2 protein [Vibrio splendidus]|uniref:glycosyltransferase family 2 protein n=1 Tax=Vibrio splendidus TaxID=29497 RepID=UPI001FB1E049|nr:glycosyltransferase family 2 protein [Vibrio splendidus]UOE88714.1 glycosyltransferase family 2 protein [Vibrio splendidus]